MLCFKFQENRNINEEFDYYEKRGGGGGREGGDPNFWILISIIIGKHMKIFGFKFQLKCTINAEFDFFKVNLKYYW